MTTKLRFTKGDRMRKAREHRGISVQAMADLMRVHRNTISAWEGEKGARPIPHSVVLAYSTFLDVDLDWLDTDVDPSDKGFTHSPCKARIAA